MHTTIYCAIHFLSLLHSLKSTSDCSQRHFVISLPGGPSGRETSELRLGSTVAFCWRRSQYKCCLAGGFGRGTGSSGCQLGNGYYCAGRSSTSRCGWCDRGERYSGRRGCSDHSHQHRNTDWSVRLVAVFRCTLLLQVSCLNRVRRSVCF